MPSLNPFEFHSPATVQETCRLLTATKDSRILAGGTFLLNSLKVLKKKGLKTPSQVISLRKVADIKGVTLSNGQLTIGAMTTINELCSSKEINGAFSALKTSCLNLATTPIRNMATVGGNLTCRYTWTEMPAVMIALNARFLFVGADGKADAIDAESFYQNGGRADKLLTKVTIPEDTSSRSVYIRISKSTPVDIPLLAVCLRATIQNKRFQNTRVTVNTITKFAQRDRRLEDFLNDKTLDPGLVPQALSARTETIYETNDEYKKHMFGVAIKNAITQMMENS